MPGPAPPCRPTFTAEDGATGERLLHAQPDRDTAAAGRQLGKHVTGGFRWRRARATAGFRLTDKPGRGRKPTPPPGGGDRQGPGLRVAGAT